jgi:predicted Zn-dependent protease with MMP-like domain
MVHLSRRQFEEAVERALERVPEEFLANLDNAAVTVEEEPSREVLRELDVPEGDTLLGAYFGTPVGERSVFHLPTGPDRIVIYRGWISYSLKYPLDLVV